METIDCTIDGRAEGQQRDAPEHAPTVPTRSPGNPACSRCRGVGDVQIEGVWVHCVCVARLSKVQRVRACWPPDVLRAAGRNEVRQSALDGRLRENLRIRAERGVLVSHLARAVVASGRIELVRIASDADLVDAWLANVGDLRDGEAAGHRGEQEARYRNVSDLVAPPKLLVLYVGVRAARLADLPDLILEAIQVRQQRGLATWVVDTTIRPLADGRCPAWREDLAAMLAGWPTVRLNSAGEAGEVGVDLTTEPTSHLKRRADPELLAAAEADGIVPKSIGKGGSVWGDCNVCGTPDSRGYVRNDFGRVARVCRPCKTGKTAKMPPEPPAAQSAPLAQDAPPAPAAKRTAKDALRAALGIGGSPVPVYPSDLEAEGWSKSSLEKALKELRRDHQIEAQKQGGRWVWMWAT